MHADSNSIRNSHETELPPYNPYPTPIEIKPNYVFSTKLPYTLYQCMLHGDEMEQKAIRRSITITFSIRVAISLFLCGIVCTFVSLLIVYQSDFFKSFFILLLFPLIYLTSQILWWRHYHRSSRDVNTYIQFNQRHMVSYSKRDQRLRQRNLNFQLLNLPPTYIETPPPNYS